MKQRIWITIATLIAYCIDKELYKAIEYLKTGRIRVKYSHNNWYRKQGQSKKLEDWQKSLPEKPGSHLFSKERIKQTQ